jgi:large subunit ribosomal protein L2
MLINKKKPRSNGTRHQINLQKNLLSKNNHLIKDLIIKHKKNSGKNDSGKITVRHKGGGCKIKQHNLTADNSYYRAMIVAILYNANSNNFLDLNFDFKSKKFFKTINIKGVFTGAFLSSGNHCKELKLGFRTTLEKLPIGSLISNLNSNRVYYSKYSRSAGSFCQIVEKKDRTCKIRLPSGKLSYFEKTFIANLGIVSNEKLKQVVLGKAGRNRLLGIRPSTRGIAMNPVDHPHGGKSNKGMSPVTPWGLPTKNRPTKKKKNYE